MADDTTGSAGDPLPNGQSDLGPHLNRVVWLLSSFSGLFLGLRLYCKLWRRRQLWWDDYLLIASWVRTYRE